MDQQTRTEPPTSAPRSATALGWHHTGWFLAVFYALAVVWGIRNIHFWQPSLLDLLVPIALAIALGCWALVDAKRRQQQQPIPILARPWFFLLAGFVVPGYVIWSRGWRGAGWVILHAGGWYGLATVIMHAGGTVVFGDEWWRAMGQSE